MRSSSAVPTATVELRATATDARVLIEVEDECGGLPPGKAEDLFLPFSQRAESRGGLGLTISRRGVEAMGGTLSVRDLPSKGCVFSIERPKASSAFGLASLRWSRRGHVAQTRHR